MKTKEISGNVTNIQLEDIYFNTEDILDENGNIIVPKNCKLSDFI